MKKQLALAVTGLLLSANAAYAHDNSCDIELDGNLQYYQGVLTVDMKNGSTMTITPEHQLSINGEVMQLDGQQQMWVSDYYTHIDSAIPMTLELAKDGLEIANVAVSEVFGELLGDDDLDDEFRDMFTSLSHELDTAFYDNQGNIRIDSDNFGESGWFGDTWESEFEQQLESLITQSMGKILISVGTQMLWEGGDMTAFEERMERFGENIEERVEAQAEALEIRADALCEVLVKADFAEDKMQSEIPGLDGLNLLNLDGHMRM